MAIVNTQKDLVNIENKIKAIKAAYTISGGMVNFVMQKSQTFSVTNSPSATFRFTPSYGLGKINLIDLRPQIKIGSYESFVPYRNVPQDGSGAVDVRIDFELYSPNITYNVTIYASGTATGTFSRIA